MGHLLTLRIDPANISTLYKYVEMLVGSFLNVKTDPQGQFSTLSLKNVTMEQVIILRNSGTVVLSGPETIGL